MKKKSLLENVSPREYVNIQRGRKKTDQEIYDKLITKYPKEKTAKLILSVPTKKDRDQYGWVNNLLALLLILLMAEKIFMVIISPNYLLVKIITILLYSIVPATLLIGIIKENIKIYNWGIFISILSIIWTSFKLIKISRYQEPYIITITILAISLSILAWILFSFVKKRLYSNSHKFDLLEKDSNQMHDFSSIGRGVKKDPKEHIPNELNKKTDISNYPSETNRIKYQKTNNILLYSLITFTILSFTLSIYTNYFNIFNIKNISLNLIAPIILIIGVKKQDKRFYIWGIIISLIKLIGTLYSLFLLGFHNMKPQLIIFTLLTITFLIMNGSLFYYLRSRLFKKS